MKKVKKFIFVANRKIGRKYIPQVPFAFSRRLDTIQDRGEDSAIKLADFSFGHLIPQQAEDCPVQGIKLSTSSCILCVCVNPSDYSNPSHCPLEGAILVPEKKFSFFLAPIQKAPEQVINLRWQLSSSILSFVWHWSKLGPLQR